VTYTLTNGDEVRVDLAEQTERDGVLDPGSLLLFAEGDPDVYFGAGPAPEEYFNVDGCFRIHQPARMEDGFIAFAHGLRLPKADGFRWASEPDSTGAWYDERLINFCINERGEVVQQGSPP